MSVYLYDDALLQKLKYWTEKSDVSVYSVEESRRLIEVLADKTDDKSIKLPIIAIRRTSGFTIDNSNKKPLAYDGLHINDENANKFNELKRQLYNGEISKKYYTEQAAQLSLISQNSSTAEINAIPISIPYKLDVYTRYQKENDIYIRNLIFNIVNFPTLQVEFKYNGIEKMHNGNMRLSNNSVSADSGSIRLFADQVVKQTLDIVIDDAYLWDLRVRKNVSVGTADLYIKEQDGWTVEDIEVL